MLDTVQVQDCKNKQIEQSRAFARHYYTNSGVGAPHLSNPGSIIVKSYFQVIPSLQKSGGTGNPSEYSQLETEAKTENTNVNRHPSSKDDQHSRKP